MYNKKQESCNIPIKEDKLNMLMLKIIAILQ